MAFGASTSVQSNPRLMAFTAGPTAPYAVTKILTSASDNYIGNWQSENIDGGGSNDILSGGGVVDLTINFTGYYAPTAADILR